MGLYCDVCNNLSMLRQFKPERLHVKSCSDEDFEQIVVVPTDSEAFVFDSDFCFPLIFQQAQGVSAEQAEVGVRVSLSDAALVFSEGHIQLPV